MVEEFMMPRKTSVRMLSNHYYEHADPSGKDLQDVQAELALSLAELNGVEFEDEERQKTVTRGIVNAISVIDDVNDTETEIEVSPLIEGSGSSRKEIPAGELELTHNDIPEEKTESED